MSPMTMLNVIREITPAECHWLRENVLAGTMVHEFVGLTYGTVRPDGIAVSTEAPDAYPFFELPRDAVEPIPSNAMRGGGHD